MAIKMTKEFLTNRPEEIAKRLVNEKKSGSNSITSTQIRKFYNDFLVLKGKSDLVKDDKEFAEKVLPLISFSKAKLAYSCGKGNITRDFVNEIGKLIDEIDNKADFNAFLNFYQALIGYVAFWSDSKK